MKAKAVAVAALVAAFVLGLAASGLHDKASPADRRASLVRPPDTHATSTARAAGAATENRQSEAGARAAAIGYATASQDWLYLSDDEIDRSIQAIATRAAGSSLSRETVSELRTARDALRRSPGRVWWLVRPLASRVERFEPTGARVAVWIVTVLSAADVDLPQAALVDLGSRSTGMQSTRPKTATGGTASTTHQRRPRDTTN